MSFLKPGALRSGFPEWVNVMKNSEFLIAGKLQKEIEHENALLKCLNTAYTGALDFIEKHDYNGFLLKLDEQHSILAEIDNAEEQIGLITEKFEDDKNKIFDLLKNGEEDGGASFILKNIADDISASKKLLRNSKILNEKLTYCVNEIQNELKQNMLALKNRKLIKSVYKNNLSKAGLIIDYKDN